MPGWKYFFLQSLKKHTRNDRWHPKQLEVTITLDLTMVRLWLTGGQGTKWIWLRSEQDCSEYKQQRLFLPFLYTFCLPPSSFSSYLSTTYSTYLLAECCYLSWLSTENPVEYFSVIMFPLKPTVDQHVITTMTHLSTVNVSDHQPPFLFTTE